MEQQAVYFVQDLLSKWDGKFSSLVEFRKNMDWKQITCNTFKLSLPYQIRWSKLHFKPQSSVNAFFQLLICSGYFSNDYTLLLYKMRCKHFY